jgi:hypothetical protein
VTDRVRKGEVLFEGKVERNVIHEIKPRKFNWMVTSCVGTMFYNTSLKERNIREGKTRNKT